jgi:hypothetical protein
VKYPLPSMSCYCCIYLCVGSRTGVFGSTTKRFHTLSDDKVPGPGFYNSEVGGEASAVPKGNQSCSSAFASSSSRATSAPNNIAPPPGQYESKISWDKGYGNGLVKSGGERFNDRKSHHEIEAPGPGAYNATIDLPKVYIAIAFVTASSVTLFCPLHSWFSSCFCGPQLFFVAYWPKSKECYGHN